MDNKSTTYKDSPYGKIPDDWKIVKCHQVANVKTGPFGAQLHESDYAVVGTPIITVEHLSEFGIAHSNLPLVTDNDKERLKQYLLQTNDIVFSRVGSVDRNSLIKETENGWMFSGRLLRVRPNEKINSSFLSCFFHFEPFKYLIRSIAVGQTMASLNTELLSNVEVILPPLPEQKAIAHILGLMDFAINSHNSLIAKKELQKKWLMQNLLTGKIRLKGFRGEWKETTLGSLFERVTRKNLEQNTNVVTISAQRGFVKQTDFFNKSIASEIIDNYFLVEKGEFCYNKSYSNGYPWGATKRLNDFDKAVVTTLYICFGIKDETNTNGDFFEQYFEANLLDKGLTQIAHEGGRAHGLLNVTPSDFFSLKITIPSFKEQTAIAKVLQAADKEIQLLKAKSDKLREQKKGLMQVLLTGKKRLNQNLVICMK